jgi:N-acetyl-1-D-myo-inositol-2-amino-2-deoxy-alpha-D-glucopyranoside deacetylase
MSLRLLLVHAHPDDETLATGVAVAHHVARGDEVTVLTCTLGEQGEIIPPELAHLGAEEDDALGPYRREELRRAMAAIGAEHRLLGERPGVLSRYRDSGMAGTPSAADPRCFVQADLDEAATLVRDVVVEVAPDLVITYDSQGGYRHPDHIQTHRVVVAAVAGLPSGARPTVLAAVTPSSWAEEDRAWLRDRGPADPSWTLPSGEHPPSVVPDERVTYEVVDADAVTAQVAALREHRTQVTVVGDQYALSNDIAARLPGREGYAEIDLTTGELVAGAPGAGRRPLREAAGR